MSPASSNIKWKKYTRTFYSWMSGQEARWRKTERRTPSSHIFVAHLTNKISNHIRLVHLCHSHPFPSLQSTSMPLSIQIFYNKLRATWTKVNGPVRFTKFLRSLERSRVVRQNSWSNSTFIAYFIQPLSTNHLLKEQRDVLVQLLNNVKSHVTTRSNWGISLQKSSNVQE